MNEFIIPPPITTYLETDKFLGHVWIRRKVYAASEAMKRKTKLHPSTIGQTFGQLRHPLIWEAYNAQTLTDQEEIPATKTPILDHLEIDLKNLAGTSLPTNFQRRLRDDNDFDKTAYELRIAAGFHRLGYDLLWNFPGHQPHPEFIALKNKLRILSVECKKRDVIDGYEKKGAKFWEHLQYHLREKLEKASLNYWIKVSGREFLLKDVQPLVSEIIQMAQSKDFGQFDSVIGRYHIDYMKLAEPGESIPLEYVNMFYRGEFGINLGKQKRAQIGKGPLKNPRLLRFEILDDPEHRVIGVLRNLKTAAKQVVPGLPNLVYIDVNIPDYQREQAEFKVIVDAVKQELSTRHRQVSDVILTNIYVSTSLDGFFGLRVRTELITHPEPTISLPLGISFPGDKLGTPWLCGTFTRRV
jgi:hypothetical protein